MKLMLFLVPVFRFGGEGMSLVLIFHAKACVLYFALRVVHF